MNDFQKDSNIFENHFHLITQKVDIGFRRFFFHNLNFLKHKFQKFSLVHYFSNVFQSIFCCLLIFITIFLTENFFWPITTYFFSVLSSLKKLLKNNKKQLSNN